MPKTPILYRESFYAELRGTRDATTGTPILQPLPWNRVETELGTMIEPRGGMFGADVSGRIQQIDMVDVGVSKISIIDDGVFQTQFGTGGGQIIDYNNV